MNTVVGREGELAAIRSWLSACAAGPAGLAITGVAGIGKTTLVEAALTLAGDRRVLVARGASAEVRLAHAGLADLLAGVHDETFSALPAPQRLALEAALLRGGGTAPEPRAVATGLLSVLEQLAAGRPLLVVIDDLQWLDTSSAAALRFAAHRLRGPVGVLTAARPPTEALRVPGPLEHLIVGPLPAAEIERLVDAVGPFSRAGLARLTAQAAGNPLVAIELARTPAAATAEPGSVPERLQAVVDARLEPLGPDARDALLYAALLTRPLVARIQALLGGRDAAPLLEAAEAAGVVALDGAHVRFIHPLLAAGVYAAATPAARRAAHGAVAALADDEEERARHLARASLTAEATLVAALDSAAATASARGAPAEAAELLELALGLGADDPERRQRAAEHHIDAGEVEPATALLAGLVAELEAGTSRARALDGLARLHVIAEDLPSAVPFLEQAIAETDDAAHRLRLRLVLAFALTQAGRIPDAAAQADSAEAEAVAVGHDGLLAEALAVRVMLHFLVGDGVDNADLERARALEDPALRGPAMLRPSFIAGLVLAWTGRLEAGLAALATARARCRESGEESELALLTMHAGRFACMQGDVALGYEIVADGLECMRRLGSPAAQSLALQNQVDVAGWVGDEATARTAAAAALEAAVSSGGRVAEMFTLAALGRVELSLGNHAAALEQLQAAVDDGVEMGSGDPDTMSWVPDALEALAASGRAADGEALGAWLEERAAALGRPTVLALAGRGRGQLHAGAGRLAEAEDALQAALEHHAQLPVRFEVARTQLALGQVQRRRRRRAAARTTLTAAQAQFAALGARPWADRAAAELERLEPGPGALLTPAEQRVAALVGAGRSNRATAAELFVSVKTVEATVARIYRKLDINSRAELGRWLADADRAA